MADHLRPQKSRATHFVHKFPDNFILSFPAQGLPTVPSLLEDELEANPFLRPNSPAIRKSLGIPASASSAEALGAIRAAKDKA